MCEWWTVLENMASCVCGLGDDTRSCVHVGVPPHALADVCVTQTNPIRSTSIFTSSLSQLKASPHPSVSADQYQPQDDLLRV